MQLTNIDRWAFIKDGGGVYRRIGAGVTSINPSNNPIVDTKHYVDAQNPSSTVYGIAKQWALAMERYTGDAANDYIASFAEEVNASTELVIVEAHDVPEDPEGGEEGYRPAKRYDITVVVNGEGAIQGGGPMDMDVVLYADKDGEDVVFDIEAGEIVA